MDAVRKPPKHSMLDLEHAVVCFVSTLILRGALAGGGLCWGMCAGDSIGRKARLKRGPQSEPESGSGQ